MPRLTCGAGWRDQLGASVCLAFASVCGSEVSGDSICCAVIMVVCVTLSGSVCDVSVCICAFIVFVCVALSGSVCGGSGSICAVRMIVSVVIENI